jgi:predicted CXXCH cytochrome family protein
MKKALGMAIAMLFVVAAVAQAQVLTSAHNMNTYITGEGGDPSSTDGQTCIYCHAPHNRASYALWNRTNNAGGDYTPYDSPTIDMTIGNPGEASLACLSCHDGTIGVDAYTGSTIPGGPYTIAAGATNVGQDLTDDHPVGITYDPAQDADFDLAANLTLAKLYTGQVECGSCHDPHDQTFGNFLIAANTNSALCNDCHIK